MNVVCGNVLRRGLLGKTSQGGSLLFPVTIQKRRGRPPVTYRPAEAAVGQPDEGRSIKVSPVSGSWRLRSQAGDSCTTISSVGQTRASSR